MRKLGIGIVLVIAAHKSSAQDAEISFGPYLQSVTTTGAYVCWVTGSSSPSTVNYGLTSAYGLTATNPDSKKEHQVALTGLVPNTVYYYQAVSTGFTATGSFKTLVEGTTFFRFVHLGEPHVEEEIAEFAEEMAAADPHLVVDSSDTVDHGLVRAEWDTFFGYVSSWAPGVAYYAAVGNHTYNMANGWPLPGSFGKREFKKIMRNPGNEEWYTVRCGNTLFISINSTWYFENPFRILGTQVDWLESQLQAATDGTDDPTFIAVYMHVPMYSSGPLYREFLERAVMRAFFEPLFTEYGVDLVLSGHDKMNQHSVKDGVHYAQSACGEIGYPFGTPNPYSIFVNNVDRCILVGEVYPDSIVCSFVSASGSVLYSFTVTP